MRKFLCFAIALFLPVIFASCGRDAGKTVLGDPMAIVTDGATDYLIVRAEDAAAHEIQATVSLRKGLAEQTGVDFKLGTDWVKKGGQIPESAKEILVGRTNRPESERAYEILSSRVNNHKDYVLITSNERIAIAATAAEGFDLAFEAFFSSHIADGVVTIRQHMEHYGKYEYPEINLNGNDLSEYVLVLGENDNYLNVQTAERFVSALEENVGYRLNITTDLDAERDKEILFGRTNRNKQDADEFSFWQYGAKLSGSKLVISGGSARALEYGALEIVKELVQTGKTDFDKDFAIKGDYLQAAKEKQGSAASAPPAAVPAGYADFESMGEAVYLIDDESFAGWWGLISGWDYDGRGAPVKTGLKRGNDNILEDISETEPTGLSREFNKWSDGFLALETAFTLTGSTDGLYYSVKNDKGQAAIRLFTKNNKAYVESGGKTNELGNISLSVLVRLKFYIDMEHQRYTVLFNDSDAGAYDFADPCDYLNLIELSTGVEETLTIRPLFTKLYANYLVNDRFLTCLEGAAPKEYEIEALGGAKAEAIKNAANSNIPDSFSLRLTTQEKGTVNVTKAFAPTGGSMVFEFKFLLENRADGISFALGNGATRAVALKTDTLSLYSGDGILVSPYYSINVWQTMRIEADTRVQKAKIKQNGKYVAEIPFENPASAFDSIEFNCGNNAVLWLDDILVFQTREYDDYVPEPAAVASEDYVVGMNICSLWRQGTHVGWDVITPYDEIKPYLGYYEDGSAEVADWEIKFMVEHGVDFQLFCWYASTPNSPMKTTHLSDALLNGYFNAKYSDKMKFALLWEASNAHCPESSQSFREHFVPYWIDYFLSDDRYLIVDNMPLIAVFGHERLMEALGGEAAVKKEFDYLRGICREMGFDGAIFMASNGSGNEGSLARTKNAGFDAVYSYNWGKAGYTIDHTKRSINSQLSTGAIHVIPTLSTGFNNVGWGGRRSPNMSVSDFEEMLIWFKDTLLARHRKDSWQSKLIMLSTWNEYGEGTYIMPSGLNGFGYLDALRGVFIGDAPHTDVRPTENQLSRLCYLYPQHRSILQPLGYETDTIPNESIRSWDFTDGEDARQWKSIFGTSTFSTEGGTVSGSAQGNDFGIGTAADNLKIDISNVTYVRVRMRNTIPSQGVSSTSELFFITQEDQNWNGNKREEVTVSTTGEWQDYYFPVYRSPLWKGTLKAIRIDPLTTPGTFEIECVELLGYEYPLEVVIDNNKLQSIFLPQTAENGEVFLSLNPQENVFNMLSLAHKWDGSSQTIRIYNQKHEVIFKMGSRTVTADGKKITLSKAPYLRDGLPTVPLQFLVDCFGYSLDRTMNTFRITTK